MDSAFDFLEKKLCPEGKAAAKRKFKVYPSAYANGWPCNIVVVSSARRKGARRSETET